MVGKLRGKYTNLLNGSRNNSNILMTIEIWQEILMQSHATTSFHLS